MSNSISKSVVEAVVDELADNLDNIQETTDVLGTSLDEFEMSDAELEAALAEFGGPTESEPDMYLGLEIPTAPTANVGRVDGPVHRPRDLGPSSVRHRGSKGLVPA